MGKAKLIPLRPCAYHEWVSGPYRYLVTEEAYTPDGKPQVGNENHWFCITCGSSFHNWEYEKNGIGPQSPGAEIYWTLPTNWQKR